MADVKQLRHGGGLQAAIDRYGGVRADWLDLSTGISPFPYPFSVVPDEAYSRLPEEHQLRDLLQIAGTAYGALPTASICAAPGTQALIQLLPSLLPAGRAVVDPMGYQEHGRCWRLAGHDVTEVADPLAAVQADKSVRYATIIHPHNPTGAWSDHGKMVAAANELARRGGLLVIDEAFCDGAPERSLVPKLPDGAIVLRSFGKFYGLAGVRVGFAISSSDMANKLSTHLGPWAVPGPAIEIARQALTDEGWRRNMAQKLEQISDRLAQEMVTAGFELVGRTDLFVTVRHPSAVAIEQALLKQHVLVRGFDQAPDTLRIGVPSSDKTHAAFMAAIKLATA